MVLPTRRGNPTTGMRPGSDLMKNIGDSSLRFNSLIYAQGKRFYSLGYFVNLPGRAADQPREVSFKLGFSSKPRSCDICG
jgi:hypothetical protein